MIQPVHQLTSSPNRIPSNQYLVGEHEFPILSLGSPPEYSSDTFRLVIDGEVENPVRLSLEEIRNLPATGMSTDFHCVTTWSKLDVKWKGVAWEEIEKLVKPKPNARHIMQYGMDDYSTNVPLEDMRMPNVLMAYELYGEPLPPEHGAPLRMIIPHMYGWKGSKFLSRIEFMTEDRSGYWEQRGYHNRGRIEGEERYS